MAIFNSYVKLPEGNTSIWDVSLLCLIAAHVDVDGLIFCQVSPAVAFPPRIAILLMSASSLGFTIMRWAGMRHFALFWSQVDGWTLPFRLSISGECSGPNNMHPSEIDCSGWIEHPREFLTWKTQKFIGLNQEKPDFTPQTVGFCFLPSYFWGITLVCVWCCYTAIQLSKFQYLWVVGPDESRNLFPMRSWDLTLSGRFSMEGDESDEWSFLS